MKGWGCKILISHTTYPTKKSFKFLYGVPGGPRKVTLFGHFFTFKGKSEILWGPVLWPFEPK